MAGMLDTQHRGTLATVVVGILMALALLAGPPSNAPAAAQANCAKAHASPGDASVDQLGDAVLCLIAKERRKADLKRVEPNGALTRVAEKHTRVMIKEDCGQHRCGDEKSLNDRIVNSGYPRPGERYSFGEITGCSLTPQGMVDSWMASRVHRKRILGKPYRDVGVGAGKGRPEFRDCGDGRRKGIYTVIFGSR
jgi:uncharacterized protein YkwD